MMFTKVCPVGCIFPMVVVSILPHAEFGRNDHQEDASLFTKQSKWLSPEKSGLQILRLKKLKLG